MSTGRRFVWFGSVLALLLVGSSFGQDRRFPPGTQPSGKPRPEVTKSQRGLPKDAVARLGQSRLRHAAKVTCVAFAPDGKSFITGGDDGSLRVWSVATGEQVNLLQKPVQGVSALKFTHGGKRLAVQFGTEALIRYLDSSTLKEVGSTPFVNRHHFGFSPDGLLVAASDLAGNLTITELENDLPKLELTGANHFDFRPDGKAIAVGDGTGTVTVHLVTGGKPVFRVKQDGAITGLSYSPNGSRLAVGSRGGGAEQISVYEPGKEKPVAEILGASIPQRWIGSDGLACGNATEAGVYDLAKKEWVGRVKGATGEYAISPGGKHLAATGAGLRVRLWDLKSGKQLHAENDSFPDPALMVGSADGRTLFLLSNDTAYQWRIGAEGARAVGTLPGRAVAAAAAGDKLLVATPGAVQLYSGFDPATPLPVKPTHPFKDSAGARSVAISANGAQVAWATEGGKVTVCDAVGKLRRELPVTTSTVLALGFNPDGTRLGVLGRDPFLRVWDVSDARGEVREVWKARIPRGLKGMVVFSPDGKYVTAVSAAQVQLFETADGKQEDEEPRRPACQFERYSDNGPVEHAAFTPDGRLLVVGSATMYGRVEVWEVATRSLVRTLVTGYGGTSRLCVFPNGKRAASSGAEEAVTVWDISFRGRSDATKGDALHAAFSDLASSEGSVGYPAVKLFASAGDRGAEYLEKATKEVVANQKRINGWVEDLSSETFSIREIASRELVEQGSRALPAVTLAADSEDPEVRGRAREVLGKLNAKGHHVPPYGMVADTLRLFRAAQALEEIGTDRAKAVLELITQTGGKPAIEARAALERLKKK